MLHHQFDHKKLRFWCTLADPFRDPQNGLSGQVLYSTGPLENGPGTPSDQARANRVKNAFLTEFLLLHINCYTHRTIIDVNTTAVHIIAHRNAHAFLGSPKKPKK